MNLGKFFALVATNTMMTQTHGGAHFFCSEGDHQHLLRALPPRPYLKFLVCSRPSIVLVACMKLHRSWALNSLGYKNFLQELDRGGGAVTFFPPPSWIVLEIKNGFWSAEESLRAEASVCFVWLCFCLRKTCGHVDTAFLTHSLSLPSLEKVSLLLIIWFPAWFPCEHMQESLDRIFFLEIPWASELTESDKTNTSFPIFVFLGGNPWGGWSEKNHSWSCVGVEQNDNVREMRVREGRVRVIDIIGERLFALRAGP